MSTTNIALIGFLLAGGAYSLLLLQLLNSWRGQLPGGLLLLSAGLTAVWGFTTAYSLGENGSISGLPSIFDAARIIAWILFLTSLVQYKKPNPGSKIDAWAMV